MGSIKVGLLRRFAPGDVAFGAVAVFLLLVFLGGGSSRADVYSLLYVRPAAVLLIFSLLVAGRSVDWSIIRMPLILFGCLALAVAVQLIPLPPSVWAGLPGHARFVEAAEAAGIAQPWRPISISPGLTLNSLVSLIVPLAALVGYAAVDVGRRAWLGFALLAAAVVSTLLGVLQLLGDPTGPLYFYEVTNNGSAVGFMANRNHQGILLAALLPLLGVLATALPARREFNYRPLVVLGLAVILLAAIILTGSRGAAVLGVVGLVALLAVDPGKLFGKSSIPWWVQAMIVVLPLLLLAALWFYARSSALTRLSLDENADLRVVNLPVVLDLIRNYLPFGSGFGTFDPAFRIAESDAALKLTYFNHAHNDLAELAMTGGIVALLVLAGLVVWVVRTGLPLFLQRTSGGSYAVFRRAAAFSIIIFLLGGIWDYPLRVPFLAATFGLMCAILADTRRGKANSRRERKG